jgi:hypothetical protein
LTGWAPERIGAAALVERRLLVIACSTEATTRSAVACIQNPMKTERAATTSNGTNAVARSEPMTPMRESSPHSQGRQRQHGDDDHQARTDERSGEVLQRTS